MSPDAFVKAQLCQFAWEQADDRVLPQLELICFVLRNRVRAGWHSGSWLENLKNAQLYSAKNYVPNSTPEFPDVRDTAFRQLLQMVDSIYDGSAEDKMTDGALFYGELAECNRQWFIENVVHQPEVHPRVAKAGRFDLFG